MLKQLSHRCGAKRLVNDDGSIKGISQQFDGLRPPLFSLAGCHGLAKPCQQNVFAWCIKQEGNRFGLQSSLTIKSGQLLTSQKLESGNGKSRCQKLGRAKAQTTVKLITSGLKTVALPVRHNRIEKYKKVGRKTTEMT